MNSIAAFIYSSACYAWFLLIFGTITNLLTCFICLRKELRVVPTFIFIAYSAAVETIPLYFRNLDTISLVIFNTSLINKYESFCRVIFLFHYFPQHSSAWLQV